MRAHAALAASLAGALLAVCSLAFLAPSTAADTPTRVYVPLEATVVNGSYVFVGPNPRFPDTIVIPAVPAVINITLVTGEEPLHTFTIRSADTTENLVDVDLTSVGQVKTVEFTMAAADQIVVGGVNRTVETEGGKLKFLCRPHAALAMEGFIVVGGVEAPTPEPQEKGVFLRAYWIGLLGMAGTLLLIGISYFVIKSSSRHYTDHHEHIRRGGP